MPVLRDRELNITLLRGRNLWLILLVVITDASDRRIRLESHVAPVM